MKRPNIKEIILINKMLFHGNTIADISKRLGFSPMVIMAYVVKNKINNVNFCSDDIPVFTLSWFDKVKNFSELCIITPQEIEACKNFTLREKTDE
jgi:hypothetical protein